MTLLIKSIFAELNTIYNLSILCSTRYMDFFILRESLNQPCHEVNNDFLTIASSIMLNDFNNGTLNFLYSRNAP